MSSQPTKQTPNSTTAEIVAVMRRLEIEDGVAACSRITDHGFIGALAGADFEAGDAAKLACDSGMDERDVIDFFIYEFTYLADRWQQLTDAARDTVPSKIKVEECLRAFEALGIAKFVQEQALTIFNGPNATTQQQGCSVAMYRMVRERLEDRGQALLAYASLCLAEWAMLVLLPGNDSAVEARTRGLFRMMSVISEELATGFDAADDEEYEDEEIIAKPAEFAARLLTRLQEEIAKKSKPANELLKSYLGSDRGCSTEAAIRTALRETLSSPAVADLVADSDGVHLLRLQIERNYADVARRAKEQQT
jgi:hypothetical protein